MELNIKIFKDPHGYSAALMHPTNPFAMPLEITTECDTAREAVEDLLDCITLPGEG